MQTPAQFGWETELIRWLRMHLNVVIPVATLAAKVLIRVFSREDFKEVLRSVANVPLELMLIAMSFMLGALSGLSDNYAKPFKSQSDADLYAALVIFAIFFASIVLNRWLMFTKVVAQKLFVAARDLQLSRIQPTIPGTEPNIPLAGRAFWAMVYCILLALMLLSSYAITVGTLAYVLHLIQWERKHMIYTLLNLAAVVLILTFVTGYMIVRAAVPDPRLRRVMLAFIIMTPFVAIWTFVMLLFSRPKPIRYNAEIGRIEDEIELERVKTFGSAIVHPSFSERWKLSYLYAMEKNAAAATARLNPSSDRSLCAVGNLL